MELYVVALDKDAFACIEKDHQGGRGELRSVVTAYWGRTLKSHRQHTETTHGLSQRFAPC